MLRRVPQSRLPLSTYQRRAPRVNNEHGHRGADRQRAAPRAAQRGRLAGPRPTANCQLRAATDEQRDPDNCSQKTSRSCARGFRALLGAEHDIEVAGEAATAKQHSPKRARYGPTLS